jgi:hypothetical protein
MRDPGIRIGVALALWLAFATAGCGDSSDEAGSSSPEEAARAYVAAINARDGKTVCGLLLDSAAYEFRIPDWGECPRFVSAYIGYAEESDTDTFHRARIIELEAGRRSGELQSIELKVEVELHEDGNDAEPIRKTLDDVLWLVERGGRWRLAKASALLYAAFDAYTVPEDLLDPPDLTAQDAQYEQETAEEREQEEAEQRSFREPEDGVLDCTGAETVYTDAPGDQHIEGSRSLNADEATRYATADIRGVEVDTEGDDLCVRFILADSEVEDLFVIRFDIYSPKQDTGYLGPDLELFMEVQADGRARLVYEELSEEDEYGRHPFVPIAARLGHDRDTFSFRVARSALPERREGGELPPWDGFLWGGITFYRVNFEGTRRAISDDVHAYLAMISYPGGKVYESGARQQRDLPTD